jgi:hypothetical protein
MVGMLKALGIPRTGHHHLGIDDCRNIVEILCELVRHGATMEPTTELAPMKYPPIHVRLRYGGAVETALLTTRSLQSLSQLAGAMFRCQISVFKRSDGTRLTEDHQLLSLLPDEELVLE